MIDIMYERLFDLPAKKQAVMTFLLKSASAELWMIVYLNHGGVKVVSINMMAIEDWRPG